MGIDGQGLVIGLVMLAGGTLVGVSPAVRFCRQCSDKTNEVIAVGAALAVALPLMSTGSLIACNAVRPPAGAEAVQVAVLGTPGR